MVGAPHVDLAFETALALVLVVGDVRREIRVLAARAHEHAVLVVAEVCRAQPQRPLAVVGVAFALEDRERVRHRARVALMQCALVAPHVELADSERRQRPANALDHERHRRAAGVRGIDARRVRQPLRQLDHVLALVAVVRDRLAARDRL